MIVLPYSSQLPVTAEHRLRMIYCPSVLCICLVALSFSHFCDCFVIGGIKSKAHCNWSQLKMTSSKADPATSSRPCCIQNFRQAAGLPRIYRCASTDPLADILNEKSWHEAERVLLQDTGLILDLRSDSERNDQQAQQWMSQAPTPFLVQDVNPETHVISSSKNDRRVLRIDVLSPTRFMDYASDNWFTPSQKAMANLYWVFDAGKVHEMRIDALNERGLTGLNEIILETGGRELCVALQEITIHLEENPNSNVAIHCVQGKDRTGMLAMLCQSIVELSDVDIVNDYHKSDSMRASSASEVMKPRRKGRLDRNVFAGSPREACVGALDFVRSKYGSVCPGYLDAIGFAEQWRQRFRSIAMAKQEASLQISKL